MRRQPEPCTWRHTKRCTWRAQDSPSAYPMHTQRGHTAASAILPSTAFSHIRCTPGPHIPAHLTLSPQPEDAPPSLSRLHPAKAAP
ncbi:hypothetical protein GDO81_012296 [Engystomops pustulosus]|uniref:Uncharacterized protein n=1 Tax=Engystomops pustulosus TaxID=76066 RepID=A0AAV7BKS3_ENGPU|nr:hypothetical protein GDO81_012296 [Engystomops pustulosus]